MRVLLLSGGSSLERDVSLCSAKVIRESLLRLGHIVHHIHLEDGWKADESFLQCDIIWIAMHGHQGEDGIIQGLCECFDRPYVSEDVLTSAIGMDKNIQSALFAQAGISTVPSIMVRKGQKLPDSLFESERYIVKMNAGGSSIAMSLTDRSGLEAALNEVFLYDEAALIQKEIRPLRELECLALLDNRNDELSVLGPIEVNAKLPFYVYENKYSADIEVIRPENVNISKAMKDEIHRQAAAAFKAVHGSLYMRIDFFLSGDHLMINEINTVPGSSPTSHFNILAEEYGGLDKTVQMLLESALKRYNKRKELRRSL